MVVRYESMSHVYQNENLNEEKENIVYRIMDKSSFNNTKVNRNDESEELSSKEYSDEKGDSELLKIPNNSNCWWPNDGEEKLDARQRWSFGSDISIEAVENSQNRLCCSPVDEFDSTVSSENEDLIVNNTDEKNESYKSCYQVSPACSPTFKKVVCASNGKKQCKAQDADTADDELIDYSKRYTTDSSNSHIQPQQRQNIVINSVTRHVPGKKPIGSRTKVYPFGDYAETDLDQPTDYSLQYAEEDTDDEEKENPQFYCNGEQDDTVKTYYTEGTPYETPSNFSNATSMSDLLSLEDNREADEVAYKRPFVREQKQEVIEKSEKTLKDCKSRTRKKFISSDAKIPILEEAGELNNLRICERKLEKPCTPPQSPAEPYDKDSKVVTFNIEENYAQETPLMFSRSSSLDSLSEFEQHSIQDDHSSVISDFSHRTSGAVSPSDLPDSPTQTVPNSPRRLERDNFRNLQQQQPQSQSQHQVQLQSQSQPQSQSQSQRIPLRPIVRKPLTPQSQLDNRVQLMQRTQPDGRASLVQHPQVDNRGPPLIQRSQTEKLFNSPVTVQPSREQLPITRLITGSSVFSDGLVSFKEESIPGKTYSIAASSLSALTIDDDNYEGENGGTNNHDIMNRIAAIRVRSSAAGMHQAPCTQKQCTNKQIRQPPPRINSDYRNGIPSKEEVHFANGTEESNDYINSYSNKEIQQNNRYHESTKEPWYENELKNEHQNQSNNSQYPARGPLLCKRSNNNDIIVCPPSAQKPEPVDEVIAMDTLKTYCTEDTPIYVSPYGSQSNLSALSMLSISDDDNFGYAAAGGPISIEHSRPFQHEAERSNSRADSYDNSDDSPNNDSPSEDEDDEERRYEAGYRGSSLAARRRIDVSPFDSQMNLASFALLCIEEEDEEEAEEEERQQQQQVRREKVNDETDESPRDEASCSEDDEDANYRRLSECSDEERQVLEECIKSGVSKITRRSFDSRALQ